MMIEKLGTLIVTKNHYGIVFEVNENYIKVCWFDNEYDYNWTVEYTHWDFAKMDFENKS